MRWIKFSDGSSYALAVDIQRFAEMNGYKVPCEQDGTRHPGTDCNAKMRTIIKDAGLRHTFKITEQSVVEIRMEDSSYNTMFLESLVDHGVVSNTYLKHKVIQLYTKEAVNALLSVMLKTHVEYEPDDNDITWHHGIPVTKRSHSLEKKKNRPKTSLFKK